MTETYGPKRPEIVSLTLLREKFANTELEHRAPRKAFAARGAQASSCCTGGNLSGAPVAPVHNVGALAIPTSVHSAL